MLIIKDNIEQENKMYKVEVQHLKDDKEIWEQLWFDKCARLQQENIKLKSQIDEVKEYFGELDITNFDDRNQYYLVEALGKDIKRILSKLGEVGKEWFIKGVKIE